MEQNTARAEADRWIGTSAKLLKGRDLIGSKSFAIRAREADPSNPIAEQILAVIDTLISAEKRVINSSNYDWYSILQVPHLTRDSDLIAVQYGRLVVLLNPDHNALPYAEYALRFVIDAWSVLSDPAKKWMYDSDLSLYLQRNSPPAPFTSFLVDQSPRVDRVDSASTFQSFQPPPQPQPQQWQPQPQPQPQPVEEQFPPQPQNQPPPPPQPDPLPQPVPPVSENPDEGGGNEQNAGKDGDDVNIDINDCDDDDDVDDDIVEEIDSFWTTCPYCYYTYEYLKIFLDCPLRCQNCRRAFQAVEIPNPPPSNTNATHFCCWGFYPLGLSTSAWNRMRSSVGSPLLFASSDAGTKKKTVKKPVVYYDEDEEEEDVSYSSDDSDSSYDWNSKRKSKKGKTVKTVKG